MRIRHTLLAVVGAMILLGALASGASARNWEISEQRLRAVFREVEFILSGGTARCQLTIEGSFHNRTAAKVSGSLVGYITRSTVGPCGAGTVTVLTETLPWHVRYSSFEGALPAIRSILAHIVGVAFRVREPGGVGCLFRSTTTEPTTVTLARETVTGVITGARAGGAIRSGVECFGIAGSFGSDSGSVTVSNSATALTIRLI
jgi:hypothetical protein